MHINALRVEDNQRIVEVNEGIELSKVDDESVYEPIEDNDNSTHLPSNSTSFIVTHQNKSLRESTVMSTPPRKPPRSPILSTVDRRCRQVDDDMSTRTTASAETSNGSSSCSSGFVDDVTGSGGSVESSMSQSGGATVQQHIGNVKVVIKNAPSTNNVDNDNG